MKSIVKTAAIAAAVAGALMASACEELAAVGQGVLMACQDNPVGCDEVFYTGKGRPPSLESTQR